MVRVAILERITSSNFLTVEWLGLGTFTARAQVQSLVGELRSHKSCSAAKSLKKKKDGQGWPQHLKIFKVVREQSSPAGKGR